MQPQPCRCLQPGQLAGNVPVGHRLSVGDFLQQLPYLLAEGASCELQGWGTTGPATAEVVGQPQADITEQGQVAAFVCAGRQVGEVLLSVKPQAGQATAVAGHRHRSQGREVGLQVGHGACV